MDIQKHLQPFFADITKLRQKQLSQKFHLVAPVLFNLLVSASKEVAIHVFALQVAAVIADNNTIWVDHRHNPELILLSQSVCKLLSRAEVVNKSVDYETAVSFPWMLSTNHKNDFPWHDLFRLKV
jgi:hypothetical protein